VTLTTKPCRAMDGEAHTIIILPNISYNVPSFYDVCRPDEGGLARVFALAKTVTKANVGERSEPQGATRARRRVKTLLN